MTLNIDQEPSLALDEQELTSIRGGSALSDAVHRLRPLPIPLPFPFPPTPPRKLDPLDAWRRLGDPPLLPKKDKPILIY